MWLYSSGEACGGSWARGDWDSRSDVDLIAVAPTREEADTCANGLRSACLGDDVIALDAGLRALAVDLKAAHGSAQGVERISTQGSASLRLAIA